MDLDARKFSAAAIAAICVWGAAVGRADKVATSPHELVDKLRPGDHCQIETIEVRTWNHRASPRYIGEVKEVTANSVTLVDVTAESRQVDSTPVFSKFQYISRYFRSARMGRSHLGDKGVELPIQRMARVEILDNEKFEEISLEPKWPLSRRKGINSP